MTTSYKLLFSIEIHEVINKTETPAVLEIFPTAKTASQLIESDMLIKSGQNKILVFANVKPSEDGGPDIYLPDNVSRFYIKLKESAADKYQEGNGTLYFSNHFQDEKPSKICLGVQHLVSDVGSYLYGDPLDEKLDGKTIAVVDIFKTDASGKFTLTDHEGKLLQRKYYIRLEHKNCFWKRPHVQVRKVTDIEGNYRFIKTPTLHES